MKSPLKNKIKNSSMKMVSVLVVIFLLSSVASTAVSKMDFSRAEEIINDETEKVTTIKESFSGFTQNLKDLIDRIRDLKSFLRGDEDEEGNIVTPHEALSAMSTGSSSLQFYTKYNAHVEETTLKIFRETKVDIDGNDEDDFSVDYRIGLGVVTPFSFSIDFKFIFEKLPGYDLLADKKGEFEAYTEIYFAGVLFKDLANKRLRVGFQSDAGEKIPEELVMTYKLVPNFLQFDKKMDHRFVLNPGADVEGKENLSLITSFTEFNNSVIVQDVISRVDYSPIVSSEISIKGYNKIGESYTEYERIRADGSKVDLYVKSTKGDVTMCAYAAGLPQHVLFMKKLARDGYIRFDTFGQPVKEIGLLDNFGDPENANKAYFSGLFSEANLTWNVNLFKEGIANLSVYTVGDGVSANIHLVGPENGTADFKATPTASLLDCDMELDMVDGYFVINRNDFEVEVEFSVSVVNESMQKYLSYLNGSFVVKKWTDGQFKILFDDILCGNVTVNLAGKSLELTDVNITGYSTFLGGEFHVRMDRFVKNFMGDVTAHLDVIQENDNITGNCSLSVINGVNITNLSLKFGAFEFARDNIDTMHNATHWYNFTIAVDLVDWHVAPDFSSGYIVIKGSSYVYFSFDSTYTDYYSGELLGKVKGIIELKTISEEFNISWNTTGGNFTFNMNGTGVAQLSEFELYLKDKVDIGIQKIKGAFSINTYNKTGSLLLEIDDSTFDITLDDIKLNITNNPQIYLKGNITLSVSGGAEGHFLFMWNESGGWLVESDFSLDATGTIDITDFEFAYQETLAIISFDRLSISGDLSAKFVKNSTGVSIIATGPITDINITGLQAYVGHLLLGVGLSDFTFTGDGEFTFTYNGEDLLLNAYLNSPSSNIVVNVLWLDLVQLALVFEGIQVSGPFAMTIAVNSSNQIPLKIIFDPDEEDIYVEHIDLGPSIIELWGLSGGKGEGDYFGLYVGTDHPSGIMDIMPVIHLDGDWLIEEFFFQGISIQNIGINGSISIEFWFEPETLSYFYMNGVSYEDTSIKLLDADVEIVIEPCHFNVMFQQNILSKISTLFSEGGQAYFYVVVDALNWVTIRLQGKEIAKTYGYLDLRLDIAVEEDGKIGILLDVREADGLLVLFDAVRIAGEFENFVLDISFYFTNDEGVISFHDLDVYTTGTFNATLWLKLSNDTGWIPFTPFPDPVTNGAVSILINEKIKKPSYAYVPNGLTTRRFYAWLSPPVNMGQTESRNFTYNLSFGDGSPNYVITTNKTEISLTSHDYPIGEYTSSLTVTVEGSPYEIYDEFDIIVKNGSYVSHTNIAPNKITQLYNMLLPNMILNYKEAEMSEDGNFHFQYKISNNADEDHPYVLHWEAWENMKDKDWYSHEWIFEPQNGTLNETEEQIINVTFPPPDGHEDHAVFPNIAYFGLDNVNYEYYPEVEDGTYSPIWIFDGFVWINPTNRLRMPVLVANETRMTGFLIKNVGWKVMNWSIDTSGMSSNGTWEFSALSGSIPPYGTAPIWLSVTAKGEGLNLNSLINVINDDNTSDFDTLNVEAISKGNTSQQNPGGYEVVTNGSEVTIKIGGLNKVEIDDLNFDINGIPAFLNGNFSLEVGENNWVYISFNTSNLSTISINGSCEFLVEDFIFRFGDNISIEVSYLVGDFEFENGRSGSISFEVNESSIDVDIDIDLSYAGTNLTMEGILDVFIEGNANGTFWIEWNLDDDYSGSPSVIFGGNLSREGTFSISLINFLFALDGFDISADELALGGSGGTISIKGDEIKISAEIDTLTVRNLRLDIDAEEFPFVGGSLELNGLINLGGEAGITIALDQSGLVLLDIYGGIFNIDIDDFLFNYNEGLLVLSWTNLSLNGFEGNITIGEKIDISVGIESFNVNDGYIHISAGLTKESGFEMDFSGEFYFHGMGGSLNICSDLKLSKIEISFVTIAPRETSISNLGLSIDSDNLTLELNVTSIDILSEGSAYLKFENKEFTIWGSRSVTISITGLKIDHNNSQNIIEVQSFDFTKDANAESIRFSFNDTLKLDFEGVMATFTVSNTNISYSSGSALIHQLKFNQFNATLFGGYGSVEFNNSTRSLVVNGSGYLNIGVNNLILGLNSYATVVEIPALNLYLGTNVGKLIINLPTNSTDANGDKSDSSKDQLIGALGEDGFTPPGGGIDPPVYDADNYILLSGDIALTGTLQDTVLNILNDSFIKLDIDGTGQLRIDNNFEVIVNTLDMGLQIDWDSLQIDVTGDGDILLDTGNLILQTTGELDVSLIDFNLNYEGSSIILGLFTNIKAVSYDFNIPTIDIDLAFGADLVNIDIQNIIDKLFGSEPPSISLTPKNSTIYIGDTLQLIPKNADGSITWWSGNNNIASVDGNGLVTGVSTGSVKIFAESEGNETNVTVNIAGNAPGTFYITPISITNFGSFQLTPENEVLPILWESSDPSIASVDSEGLVTIHRIGIVTITATDGSQNTATSTIISTGKEIELSVEGSFSLIGNGALNVIINGSELLFDASGNANVVLNNFNLTGIIRNMNEQFEEIKRTELKLSVESASFEGPTNFHFSNIDNVTTLSFDVGLLSINQFYISVDLLPNLEIGFDTLQLGDVSGMVIFEKWTKNHSGTPSGNVSNFLKIVLDFFSENSGFVIEDIKILKSGFGIDFNIDGEGDIDFRRYRIDYTSGRPHVYTRIGSNDGFSGDISITGPFDIMTVGGELTITPGHFTMQRNIDNDGYIYFDTSGDLFHIDGDIVFYFLNVGLRINFYDFVFIADDLSLHWDNFFPPQGFYKSGSIFPSQGSLEIDVGEDFDEDGVYTWYDLRLPPFAKFSYNVQGLTLHVDASDSFDLDGNIVSYGWKWSAIQAFWDELGPITSHTYLAHGWKTVKLRVIDNHGLEDIITKDIYV